MASWVATSGLDGGTAGEWRDGQGCGLVAVWLSVLEAGWMNVRILDGWWRYWMGGGGLDGWWRSGWIVASGWVVADWMDGGGLH